VIARKDSEPTVAFGDRLDGVLVTMRELDPSRSREIWFAISPLDEDDEQQALSIMKTTVYQ
jgi:hypothetical protein